MTCLRVHSKSVVELQTEPGLLIPRSLFQPVDILSIYDAANENTKSKAAYDTILVFTLTYHLCLHPSSSATSAPLSL